MTAPNESGPQPHPAEPGDPVPVFLLNGTRTSGGTGPGPVKVPPAEAGRLLAARIAISGDRPPQGWPG